MAFCVECDEEYSDKRMALGYDTCLDCGRKEAIQEARRKAKRVTVAYNKGGYQYMSDDTIKNDLAVMGRKV